MSTILIVVVLILLLGGGGGYYGYSRYGGSGLGLAFVRRLANVENIQQQDSAGGTLNKLTRTYATQMETLKRYRTGGEQKVTVQHVSVSEGGQAIVGNVTQAPRENAPEKIAASPLAITDAKTAAMPMIGENKESVPVPAPRRRDK